MKKFDNLIEANDPVIMNAGVNKGSFWFSWGWEGIGFGEFHVETVAAATPMFRIDDENMGRKASQKLLNAFGKYILEHQVVT